MIIPCLSLRQPWAEFILDPKIGKDVENRGWNTNHRGTFLIHAAKTYTSAEYDAACSWASNEIDEGIDEHFPRPCDLEFGGIVGAAKLDCVEGPSQRGSAWHMWNQYGFYLAKPTRLPFRPYRGALGFFRVELTAEEERLLREAGLL